MWILVFFCTSVSFTSQHFWAEFGYLCLGDEAGLRYSHVGAWTHSAYLPHPPPPLRPFRLLTSLLILICTGTPPWLLKSRSQILSVICSSVAESNTEPWSRISGRDFGALNLTFAVKPDGRKATARCVMQHLSESLLSPVGDINLLNSLTTFITVTSCRFSLFAVPPLCTLQK